MEAELDGDHTLPRFVGAGVEASRWVRGMLARAFASLPPSGVTMPQFASLIVAADERVFPPFRAGSAPGCSPRAS